MGRKPKNAGSAAEEDKEGGEELESK